MTDSVTAEPAAPTATGTREGTAGEPPLTGVRVLDLTQVMAGPFCTTMLADLGAEVVKLERPGVGDEMRGIGRYAGREEHEDLFYASNRCKKSIALDLKDPTQREVGRTLAERADVVVENFAPGTADRLGMGWRDLQPRNPRLVYCSISGFGQTGPYRNRLAVDPIIQGISGVMSVTGFPDGDPVTVGAPLADIISGMFAAYAVLGALHGVARDDRGQYIDMSMQAGMIAALGPRMGEALQAGISPDRFGNENPMRVPSDTYRTSDGAFLHITVANDRHWAPFCRALDREDWIDDPRFATMRLRVRNREELRELVAARFAEGALAAWVPRLESERVPHGPVNSYVQALADTQVVHRGLVRTLDHPVSGPIKVIGPPWQSTRESPATTPPPLLGQHTDEVLGAWLGWGAEEIDRFREETSTAGPAASAAGNRA